MNLYQIDTDGLTLAPQYRRRYAVINSITREVMLETDDRRRAGEYAEELNRAAYRQMCALARKAG